MQIPPAFSFPTLPLTTYHVAPSNIRANDTVAIVDVTGNLSVESRTIRFEDGQTIPNDVYRFSAKVVDSTSKALIGTNIVVIAPIPGSVPRQSKPWMTTGRYLLLGNQLKAEELRYFDNNTIFKHGVDGPPMYKVIKPKANDEFAGFGLLPTLASHLGQDPDICHAFVEAATEVACSGNSEFVRYAAYELRGIEYHLVKFQNTGKEDWNWYEKKVIQPLVNTPPTNSGAGDLYRAALACLVSLEHSEDQVTNRAAAERLLSTLECQQLAASDEPALSELRLYRIELPWSRAKKILDFQPRSAPRTWILRNTGFPKNEVELSQLLAILGSPEPEVVEMALTRFAEQATRPDLKPISSLRTKPAQWDRLIEHWRAHAKELLPAKS